MTYVLKLKNVNSCVFFFAGKKIEYDPDFKGPMKNRSCTDILCLGLFVVFIGCWIGVACYGKLPCSYVWVNSKVVIF